MVERSNIIIDGNGYTLQGSGALLSKGINLTGRSNVTIKNTRITNNGIGIWLWSSSGNSIRGNNITNNLNGISLSSSFNNSIVGNNITANNSYGIYFTDYSPSNRFYHNNFVDNTRQANRYDYANVWDDGYPSGGNYWSNYAGVDTDNDAIGDEPYTIDANNTDRYPLIGPFNVFDAGIWDGTAYNVDVVSDSSVSEFQFDPSEGALLRFNVTGEEGTEGFCRVTIPKDLLWVEDGWTIFVGGEPITDYTVIPDENFTYLYFTYNHSTKAVVIQGTHVVPEFPSTITLPLFMLTTLIATVLLKKKRKTKP